MTRLRAGFGETFSSLGIRNFRLFFGGQFVAQVGRWLVMIAQTLLVLDLTDSGVALGLLAAAQFGPVLVLGPFAGLVADRSDKRRLLLVVQVGTMAQTFAMAALAFTGSPPVALVYLVAAVGGVGLAFDNPARRSFVVEMVPEDRINNAVSLNSALMTGARVVGPAVAGALVLAVGYGTTFVLGGLAYTAVLAGLWRIDPADLRRPPVTPRGPGQIREGIRYARSLPDLWVPLAMMALAGTLAYNFQTVLPLFATRDLAGGDLTYTVLMSVVSAGSLVGALAVARRRSISVAVVAWSAVAFGAALGLLALAPSLGAAVAVSLVLGLASISFMTASTAIVQLRSEPAMRGRVLALQAMVFLGSTPIGGPIVGTVAERYGARWALAVGAAAALVAGTAGLVHARRARRTALTPAQADAAVAEAVTDLAREPEPVPRAGAALAGRTPAAVPGARRRAS